jgi:uncharacterized integral membrane protein
MGFLAVKAIVFTLMLNFAVHIGSSMAFGSVCLPRTVWDVPLSFVTTASPVCGLFLKVMQMTQNNFAIAMTTTIAAVIAQMLDHERL